MPSVALLDGRRHDRQRFHCGVGPLDRYIRTQATQDVSRRAAVCYVMGGDDDSGRILGYYTLSNLSIWLNDISVAQRKKFARYPQVPATLIGRFTIDSDYHGQGFGECLLVDALKRALDTAGVTGSAVVVVDTKDESGRLFLSAIRFRMYL